MQPNHPNLGEHVLQLQVPHGAVFKAAVEVTGALGRDDGAVRGGVGAAHELAQSRGDLGRRVV